MRYAFESELRDGYLHIRVRGRNDAPTVHRYLRDVLAACNRESCPNVLIEEMLEGPRMAVGDIFKIITERSGDFRPNMRLVAFVDVNAETMTNMKFAETVAVNRGVTVGAFPEVAEAEKWMRKKLDAAARRRKPVDD